MGAALASPVTYDPADSPAAPGADVPDDAFSVHLDNFEGPFDLLLQLIAKHKLDITEVALSRVTDEFLAHVKAMGPDWDLEHTTSFLVVAATLLDLKIVRLLPSAELEDEEDLALLEARDLLFARLLQYRAFKEVAAIIADRMSAESRRVPRTVGVDDRFASLLPDVVITMGLGEFAAMASAVLTPRAEPTLPMAHLHASRVSVRDQAHWLVGRLRNVQSATFRALTSDSPDRLTTVARFLALLELYREGAVAFEQLNPLGELSVRWTGSGEGDIEVSDDYDEHSKVGNSHSAGSHSVGADSALTDDDHLSDEERIDDE
jgi:segregation and condensation protein A